MRNVVILHCQKNESEDKNEDCHPEGEVNVSVNVNVLGTRLLTH